MKRALLNLSVASLVLMLGATGCKRPEKGVTPISGRDAAPIDTGTTSNPPLGGMPGDGDDLTSTDLDNGMIPQAGLGTFEGYIMDPEAFAGQTIYFDFDSSVVKLSEIDKVNAVGDELKLRPMVKLLIDGHCDERGTEEYNRALGDRRALSTREVLVKYGIDRDRIRTRSWGEDMPADPGHDQAAWARNRRAEFIMLLPPTN
jgi:peptidoglycan-associated lipoprotein